MPENIFWLQILRSYSSKKLNAIILDENYYMLWLRVDILQMENYYIRLLYNFSKWYYVCNT